jgi:hypothetical protein
MASPGKVTSGIGMDSVVIHAAVFTSLGTFGEATWTTTMFKNTEALVNVYLTDEPLLNYTDPAEMRGNRMGIPSASTQTFQIALAELNTSSQQIEAGAQIIINVPKEWTVITPLNSYVGFVDPPTINNFPDGSSQIVGELIGPLASGANIISFDAVAPSVACDKMYVMHILANGVTNNDNPIGPIAEIVLQVNPIGACP